MKGGLGSLPPVLVWLISTWLPGLDAQLVIRPLMEKMQKKGYDAVLRKFTFPHVSAALSRVLCLARQAGRAGSSCGRRLVPSLPRWVPSLPLVRLKAPAVERARGGSWQARLAGPAGSPISGLPSHTTQSFTSPAPVSPAPQGISALAQPFLPGCGFTSVSARFCMQRRLVSCARKARLLLFQFSQHLELWRLGSTDETGELRDPGLRCKPCGRVHAACRISDMNCPAAWVAEGWFSCAAWAQAHTVLANAVLPAAITPAQGCGEEGARAAQPG